MNFPISLFIALRYWRAKSADRFGRLVTHLASFGILLGVTALIIVLTVMNGLEQHQKKQVLASIPHAIIRAEKPILATAPLPQAADFISKIVPINTVQVIFQTDKTVTAGQVIGIQSFSDDPLLADFASEKFSNILPTGSFNLIIGSELAEKLGVNIGDKVRLMITENSQYTPFGRVPMQRLFTIGGIYFDTSEISGYEVFANLTDIGRLMRISPERIQGYRLFLTDPFLITQLPKTYSDYQINDWRIQKGEFFQAVRMEKNMMGLLISLIIIVAVSNIVTSLSLMVVDKQGEIAILQTQGMTKSQIRTIFVLQGLLVGVGGTIPGTILGIVVALNLNQILSAVNFTQVYLPVSLSFEQIVTVATFSLLLSLLSTLYPAYRAAKIAPAEALRYQ